MNKNRVIGIVLGLVSTYFLYMTSQLPISKYSTVIGPRVFPYIASGGLLLCAIGLFFKRETEEDKNKGPFLTKEGWFRILKLCLLLASFPLLFTYLGFIVAAVVLLYIMITMFDIEKTEKIWKKAVTTASVTAVLYALFTYIIKIQLPKGKLFEWLF